MCKCVELYASAGRALIVIVIGLVVLVIAEGVKKKKKTGSRENPSEEKLPPHVKLIFEPLDGAPFCEFPYRVLSSTVCTA